MLTSPERVQMTTLASACQSNLGSRNDAVRITIRILRMLPESWVMIAKGGVVDKSGAFAPMYPPFVMRNSEQRSSFFCETKIVSVFFH